MIAHLHHLVAEGHAATIERNGTVLFARIGPRKRHPAIPLEMNVIPSERRLATRVEESCVLLAAGKTAKRKIPPLRARAALRSGCRLIDS